MLMVSSARLSVVKQSSFDLLDNMAAVWQGWMHSIQQRKRKLLMPAWGTDLALSFILGGRMNLLVRAPDLKSGDPGFKPRSDHRLYLFQVELCCLFHCWSDSGLRGYEDWWALPSVLNTKILAKPSCFWFTVHCWLCNPVMLFFKHI